MSLAINSGQHQSEATGEMGEFFDQFRSWLWKGPQPLRGCIVDIFDTDEQAC